MISSKAVLDIGVLTATIVMMVAVGMEMDKTHFRSMAQRKSILFLTFAGQAVILPVLGFGITHLMALPSPISAGIMLLAACPVGDIANFYTLLARGNIALSVTVNTVSCTMSMLSMAMVFGIYDLVLGDHFVFAVPTPALVARLTLMVVLPVLAGMWLRRFRPGFVARHAVTLRNASLFGVALLVVYVIVTQGERIVAEWQHTALAGTAFMVLALAGGLAFGWLLRLKAGDIVTVGTLFATRNVGLAMAIAITLLHRSDYAAFAVVYFLAEVPLLLGVASLARRWYGTHESITSYGGGVTAAAHPFSEDGITYHRETTK